MCISSTLTKLVNGLKYFLSFSSSLAQLSYLNYSRQAQTGQQPPGRHEPVEAGDAQAEERRLAAPGLAARAAPLPPPPPVAVAVVVVGAAAAGLQVVNAGLGRGGRVVSVLPVLLLGAVAAGGRGGGAGAAGGGRRRGRADMAVVMLMLMVVVVVVALLETIS